ncbi:ubiquinone biosynthesis regulatory protein kinase UbiB [Porticoccus sp. W117]|uniref:ubiquinone biosynthesis regulatory protein kinase UbiB n=1 Tax=Porticoccus sp. W117 TaxID=3054777 RepID=UPI00259A871E|nr:ubiquinone biosynthesis regulatory protein kinase UbiB [Porticoccus sp. W117]MDM3871588.1 ubiquinone biosynthesis regulatory protein kinase UbiB [Porticoccus sp. W117]
MRRIRRLAKIIRVFQRHRLDTFFNDQKLPPALKLLVKPAQLLPEPKRSRGERLRLALEELGPVFVKFGQLLSTRPDLVPADIVSELDKLQDNVPPFEPQQFTDIVEAALGDSVDNLFGHFSRKPLASASVAQVHAATLKDGTEVVVKAIRPGIEKTIEQDLLLLETVAALVARTTEGRRLRPEEIVQDYRTTILDELNLQHEAANTSLLRRNFDTAELGGLLYVPEVYWDYSNEQVMVTERIYATPVTDVAALSEQKTDFKALAERGVEIFFTQVFDHNFFHADMHPGNIFVDASQPNQPRYLAVDCAIMGTLSDNDQYYLARNLLAIFRRDYRQVAELHVLSGWVPEQTPINEFTSAIRAVCEPIFQRPLSEISYGHILVSLFRTARRFDMEMQPSLVLLQKTLLNVEGLGRQLHPDLDLWATAHPFLERWLKRRVSPSALLEKIKRYGPEWLEHFPQIPQMVYRSLQQIERLENTLATSRPPQRRRPLLNLLIGVLIGTAIGVALAAVLTVS